jgi:Domain of unknown function (DUF4430)
MKGIHILMARSPKTASTIVSPLAAICLAILIAGCRQRPAPADDNSAPKPPPTGSAVQLVIDYGDGAQKRFAAIAWRENMTVLDALEAAKANPHGITFSVRGSGEQALLTKLDDVANQEGVEGAKNWIFYVNDHMADRSLGATTIKPGDAILWKFQRYVE